VAAVSLRQKSGVRLLRWIRQIGERKLAADGREAGYPGIEERSVIYAVGDIHGRSDLLDRVFKAIDRNRLLDPDKRALEIYLGDYVDRGPDSAGVIARLRQRASERPVRLLLGNHEAMFMDFLGGKSERKWLENGGAATAFSYGVDPRLGSDLQEALTRAVPPDDLVFLNSLRPSFRYGPYFFVHAGIRPNRPIENQSLDDLIWIRKEFLDHPGSFGPIVVHGHTPNAEPDFRPNRINLDTGAFATNRLTCLRIDSNGAALLPDDVG
jgi:serine/threonine protein phosphatase 1